MAMKKTISKALAMAVMMSVLAGGSAYAETKVIINGILDSTSHADPANGPSVKVVKDPYGSASYGYSFAQFNQNGKVMTVGSYGINLFSDNSIGIHNMADGVNPNDAVNKGQMDTALKGKVDAGTATGLDALAVSKLSEAQGDYSVAIGDNAFAEGEFAHAIGAYSYAKGKDSFAVGVDAIAYADYSFALGNESVADEANTISVGGGIANIKRRITNVGDGVKDSDAATFGQIKAVDGNYVKEANTVAQNFTALDDQVKTNADDIATLKTDKADKAYVDTELGKKADKATTLAGYGITDGATKTELNAKADKATTLAGYGITDAYTAAQTDNAISSAIAGKADKSYVETELSKKTDKTALDTETQERKDADADLQKQIDAISGGASTAALEKLDSKINQTDARLNRVGATAAALAGIHYQPMTKGQSQVAVGMGGYKGKKATAIGMAYQFSDRVSGSVAGSANGSEHMFNVGFNYLFGQHTAKDVAPMAAGSLSLAEAELKAENSALKNKVADQEARISRLEKIIASLGK